MDDEDFGIFSQKSLNLDQLVGGDIQVENAPILPFLKAPVKKPRNPAVFKPFKLPGGVQRDPNAKPPQLGVKRRPAGFLPSVPYKRPDLSPGTPIPTEEDISFAAAAIQAEKEAEELRKREEEERNKAKKVELPEGYEPLVLHDPEDPPRFDAEGNVCSDPSTPISKEDIDPDAAKVVVEDFIGVSLREHQREGVQFMFSCIHSMRGFNGAGCILADDMGLGKTLQSIALIYTVLKQGLKKSQTEVKRVIVVCPTSLVNNWANEIQKWLGDRVKPLPLAEVSRNEAIRDITTFLTSRTYPVLIISYETFRIHAKRFHARPDSCDLLICDEAHRLKNGATLTNQALAGLACRRRILLSGTPMQNDLEEFYAMVDFTNPGILGDGPTFRRRYESPILVGREPTATEKQKQAAEDASTELSNIVNKFILRRTNTLLSKHLPPKLLQVVCIKMSPLQQALYEHFLQSKTVSSLLEGKQTGVLSSITALRKLVNHPRLIADMVRMRVANGGSLNRLSGEAAGFEGALDFFPPGWIQGNDRGSCPDMSGKFLVTTRMLDILRKRTKDRIVIVSCYTQTLDVFSTLCRENKWPVIRLDGSTNPGKRQKLVDQFNNPKNDEFVFLLSSKAGGCGLNLIGANRLILFDPDWNPATDLQAAARVWRDGQRKQVYVYRFLATGTLEEKVFQRQLSKKGLQTIVVEEGEEAQSLSADDLRNLFQLSIDTPSDTHDTLRCHRCRNPEVEEGESDTELEKLKTLDEQLAKEAEKLILQDTSQQELQQNPSDVNCVTPSNHVMKDSSSDPENIEHEAGSAKSLSSRVTDEGELGPPLKLPRSDTTSSIVPSVVTTGVEVISLDTSTSDIDHLELKNEELSSCAGVNASPSAAHRSFVLLDGSTPEKLQLRAGKRLLKEEASDDPSLFEFASVPDSSTDHANHPSTVHDTVQGLDYDDEVLDLWDDSLSSSDDEGARKRRRKPKQKKGKSEKSSNEQSKRSQRQAAMREKQYTAQYAAAVRAAMAKPLPPVEEGVVRRQLKLPSEDDLRAWRHHMGTAGVGVRDDVLAEAGRELVTFVFGLDIPGRDLKELNEALDQKEKERQKLMAAEEMQRKMEEMAAAMAKRNNANKTSGLNSGLAQGLAILQGKGRDQNPSNVKNGNGKFSIGAALLNRKALPVHGGGGKRALVTPTRGKGKAASRAEKKKGRSDGSDDDEFDSDNDIDDLLDDDEDNEGEDLDSEGEDAMAAEDDGQGATVDDEDMATPSPKKAVPIMRSPPSDSSRPSRIKGTSRVDSLQSLKAPASSSDFMDDDAFGAFLKSMTTD